ncbi:MAG: hypothetical protein ABIC40_03045, partial [bacterium]
MHLKSSVVRVALVLSSVLIFISCSTHRSDPSRFSEPITPALSGNQLSNDESAGHYLWAYDLISIDPEKLEAEIVPMRMAGTHLNVLKWLEKGPCVNCVTVKSIKPSGSGTLLVDVELRHPFYALNLTGFDIRGITMFAGSHNFPNSELIASDRSKGEGALVNAEGFTALYNPTTAGCGPDGMQGYLKGKYASADFPNSTLNGYLRHISPDPSNTRNAFLPYDSIVRTYEIAMPNGPFVFGYAVDANWAPPTNKPVTDPMADFPPEANCPEPWQINVSETPVGDGLT